MSRRRRALSLGVLVLAVAFVSADSASADAPLAVMHYGVSVSGTQETTWSLAGGIDVQGSEAACQAPIEAGGHMLQTLSTPRPGTLTVASAGEPAISGLLSLTVASDRTGTDVIHWAAVNATGGCNRAPRVDTVHSQVRCGAFSYRLPLRLGAPAGLLVVATSPDDAVGDAGRFDGERSDECPWVEAASGLVLGEFGQGETFPVVSGGLLAARGPAPDLTRLAHGVLTVPVDQDTTYTATGTSEPWAGTMTLHVVLHLLVSLTPLGGEDNSIEPGLGIGGVHLGDTLDTVRRLYPHVAIVRRLPGRSGHALWLVGVRGGTFGLQAIVGVSGGGTATPPGSATVREVETTFATPGNPRSTFHTGAGIGAGSTVAEIRRALHGHGLAWRRAVDGRTFNSWYVPGHGRVVTEFDLGQASFSAPYARRARGYQVRIGCPGTSRVPQYLGRPAAGPC